MSGAALLRANPSHQDGASGSLSSSPHCPQGHTQRGRPLPDPDQDPIPPHLPRGAAHPNSGCHELPGPSQPCMCWEPLTQANLLPWTRVGVTHTQDMGLAVSPLRQVGPSGKRSARTWVYSRVDTASEHRNAPAHVSSHLRASMSWHRPQPSYHVCPLSGRGEWPGLMKFGDGRGGGCQGDPGVLCWWGLGLQDGPMAPAAARHLQPLDPMNAHVGSPPKPRKLFLWLGLAYVFRLVGLRPKSSTHAHGSCPLS